MVKEIERLKRYIDNVEDENEAYKNHIAQHMMTQQESKMLQCEECLQTDNLHSVRKSNKQVGASLKSVAASYLQNDSCENVVTLEPHDFHKSINISTNQEPDPSYGGDTMTRRSHNANFVISKVSVFI